MVSLAGAIALGFQRYFDFSGRSSRSEYWWWFLFSSLVGLIHSLDFFYSFQTLQSESVAYMTSIGRAGGYYLHFSSSGFCLSLFCFFYIGQHVQVIKAIINMGMYSNQ